MTDIELYSLVRELVGDPSPNDVSQRKFMPYVISATEWLASELEYAVKEDNVITLVAGQVTYPLPADLLTVVWISYNNLKLEPSSLFTWDRDGTAWRAPTAGKPTGFAVQGRELFLNPSPDATNITANPVIRMRWLAAPTQIERGGPAGLSELDSRLLCYQAAALYCMTHAQDPANATRKQDYEAWVGAQLPQAKQRAQNAIMDFQASFRPIVGRRGAAR